MNIKCPICHKEQSHKEQFVAYKLECCVKVALNCFKYNVNLMYIIINNIQINFFYLFDDALDIPFLVKE